MFLTEFSTALTFYALNAYFIGAHEIASLSYALNAYFIGAHEIASLSCYFCVKTKVEESKIVRYSPA